MGPRPSAAQVLALQRHIGNRSLQRLLAPNGTLSGPAPVQRYGASAGRTIPSPEQEEGDRLEALLQEWKKLTANIEAETDAEAKKPFLGKRARLGLPISECLRLIDPDLVAEDLRPSLEEFQAFMNKAAELGPSAKTIPIGSSAMLYDLRYPGTFKKDTWLMDNWAIPKNVETFADVIGQAGTISFVHTTTQKQIPNMDSQALKIFAGDKEFGPGFYTTSAEGLAPAKLIGTEWFGKKQGDELWSVITFEVPTQFANFLMCTGPRAVELNKSLNHVLTHERGFRHGGQVANEEDLREINEINLQGRVLIFPGDKDRVVQTVLGDKSWMDYTKAKGGGGNYELVVGPQQPEYMGDWRQIVFAGQRAMWLINTAKRHVVYENKKSHH